MEATQLHNPTSCQTTSYYTTRYYAPGPTKGGEPTRPSRELVSYIHFDLNI